VWGGSTARRCYERLAREPAVDWSEVEVLISDERWVPVAHEDSNEGMARRTLLDRVPVKVINSMRDAGPTMEAAADAYDRLLSLIGGIDLLHLGIGDDGHTASLFPGSPALAVDDRYVVATGDDLHDWPRLSFTYPGIALGRLVVVTVSGSGKREAFGRVRDGDPTAPAVRIDGQSTVWLVDPTAAGA
jgi:6-phosphogluconolactonase